MFTDYIVILLLLAFMLIFIIAYHIYCFISLIIYKGKVKSGEIASLEKGLKLNIYFLLIKMSRKLKDATKLKFKKLAVKKVNSCIIMIVIVVSILNISLYGTFTCIMAFYGLDYQFITASTILQSILTADDDCVCYAKCTTESSDDSKCTYELLFGRTEYEKIVASMYKSLSDGLKEQFEEIDSGTDGKAKNDFLRNHLTNKMLSDYKYIVTSNSKFRAADKKDRRKMSDDELMADLKVLLSDHKTNGRNLSCNCQNYSKTLLSRKCMGVTHYKDGWSWESLWGTSDSSINIGKPGTASGQYAIQLNDGTYYWYHQSQEICDYNERSSQYGYVSDILPGLPGTGSLMWGRGCGIYSIAIALSNLMGEPITPINVITNVMNCNIEMGQNGVYQFNATGDNGIDYREGPIMNMYRLAELINSEYSTYGIKAEVKSYTKENIDNAFNDKSKYTYIINSYTSSDTDGMTWYTGGGHFMVLRGKDSNGKYYCFTSYKTDYGKEHKDIAQGMSDGLDWEIIKSDGGCANHSSALFISRDISYYQSYSSESEDGGIVFDFRAGGNFECPYKNHYTYMGWQMVTSTSSKQYTWRQNLFPDWINGKDEPGSDSAFDSEGFGRVGDRYVVAVTRRADGGIGEIGDKLNVYLENGQILKCIVGDIKSSGDANWSRWGHLNDAETSVSTIEFIVNRNNSSTVKWYDITKEGPYKWNHANAGTPTCHPEWKSNILKIVVLNENAESSGNKPSTNTQKSKGQEVVDYAMQFVGNHYVWGGTDPTCKNWTPETTLNCTRGVDCSGFTQYVYKHFNISIPKYSGDQRSVGREVKESDIRPGDLVCYDGHVAIYMGNGQIVHASGSKVGIVAGSNWKYKPYITIRRLVE